MLVCYAWCNPDVGYAQGFNFIAGFLLLRLSDEQSVFALLTTLVNYVVPGYHSLNLEGVLVDQAVCATLSGAVHVDVMMCVSCSVNS